jgi:Uncharacterized alpha/beta hydrolase domain (DUF2235)
VWDTVDAYGLPINELKQGIDKYLWPLALEDRTLEPTIEKACHALSIDDKRRTFHPLLWDESDIGLYPLRNHTDQERLTQVWFAGVHSNVGGGYPDDTLSYNSLLWMIREAQKKSLKFHASALAQLEAIASPYGRIYDSRYGFGAYYRYEPRGLDPARDNQGAQIPSPKIHFSVIWRMAHGADAYAPLSLPAQLRIVSDLPPRVESSLSGNSLASNIFSFDSYATAVRGLASLVRDAHGDTFAHSQGNIPLLVQPSSETLALIWDTVWWRRIVYFATLGTGLLLIAFPFVDLVSTLLGKLYSILIDPIFVVIPPNLFDMLLTLLLRLSELVHRFVPAVFQPWAYALRSFDFCLLVATVIAFLRLGSLLDRRIQDRALAAWNLNWRARRKKWFDQTYKPRIAAAFVTAAFLCVWAFSDLMSRMPEIGTSSSFWSDFHHMPYTLHQYMELVPLVTVAVFLMSLCAVLFWIYSQISVAKSVPEADGESPGLALRISRHLRTSRTLTRLVTWFSAQVIPFVSAGATVAVLLWAVSRVPFDILDAANLFCSPRNEFEELRKVDWKEPVVIDHKLSAFCASSNILLPEGDHEYAIVTDYFSQESGPVYSGPDYSLFAIPFRRVMSQPWSVTIGRVGGTKNQFIVSEYRATHTVRINGPAVLDFYVNGMFVPLPFVYDWFYRVFYDDRTARITITNLGCATGAVCTPP